MLNFFLILNLVFCSGFSDSLETNWKLKKEENNIKVFLRKTLDDRQEYLARIVYISYSKDAIINRRN